MVHPSETTSVVHPVGAALTGLTTVVEADTAEAATMIAIVDLLDMMIENAAHTDDETITALVVSTGMLLQVATIVIAAEGMIAVAAMTTTAETVGVLIMLGMASQCRQEIIGIHMAEVRTAPPNKACLLLTSSSLPASQPRSSMIQLISIALLCYNRFIILFSLLLLFGVEEQSWRMLSLDPTTFGIMSFSATFLG